MGRTIPLSDKRKNYGFQRIRAFEDGPGEVMKVRDGVMKHLQVDLCDDSRTQETSIVKVRRTVYAEVGGGCFQSADGHYLA